MSALLPLSDVAHKPYTTIVLLACLINSSAARILKRPSPAGGHAGYVLPGNWEVARKTGTCWWWASTSRRRSVATFSRGMHSSGFRLPKRHLDFCGAHSCHSSDSAVGRRKERGHFGGTRIQRIPWQISPTRAGNRRKSNVPSQDSLRILGGLISGCTRSVLLAGRRAGKHGSWCGNVGPHLANARPRRILCSTSCVPPDPCSSD